MRRLIVLLALIVPMSACSRCDRGACLKSHVLHHPAYWTVRSESYACGVRTTGTGKHRSTSTRWCTRWLPHYVPVK